MSDLATFIKGILLIDKSPGCTSFQIVSQLRRLTGVQTIGHAGTLDPFATGVMVLLIGRDYTRKSDSFLTNDKEYRATLRLGQSTQTYDLEGAITQESDRIPTESEVLQALQSFQGKVLQTPPMFSAKKVQGQKLCNLARKGIVVEREPVWVEMKITLLRLSYPYLEIQVSCSKGTYIRSLAHDLGELLGCGAHLTALCRLRSGPFRLEECIPQTDLLKPDFKILPHLRY